MLMRYIRPLFLLATLAILAGLGFTYYARLKLQFANAPAKPKALAPGTAASYHGWTYTHTSSQNTVIKVTAEDLIEVDGKQQLTGVQLDIYHKEGGEYDHVTCAKAHFDMNQGILYSDGAVKITLGMKPDEPPSGKLMSIESSDVQVESKTGKATTDHLATFKFDRGDGSAVGADYDPNTRELKMHSQVELTWRGTDPKTPPMKVETGDLYYKERDQKVYLAPWAKLTRESMTLEAGPAEVTLDHGSLKQVDTTQAHGTDQRPGRNLAYSASLLHLDFDDSNEIQKITATDQARLVNTADTTITTLTADQVVMDFDTSGDGSLLQSAVATGHSSMESRPVIKQGVDPSDTRILKSEVIRTKMRPGGRELDSVETDSAGAIEFIPNKPDQPHRWMNGDRVWIAYADKNWIKSFRSVSVTTRTEKPRLPGAKETPAPELTWSKDLLATFQPNSSQLAKLEQWNDFRYESGDRRAKAARAVLDQPNDKIDLTGAARVWDSTGSADADKILLDQQSGDMAAEGNVTSTRMPDKHKNDSQGGGMLSEDEPLHARAAKMQTSDNNLQVRYQGHAVLWQGANRLEADVVEIDRDNNLLKAHGQVTSQLVDKSNDDPPGDDAKSKATQPSKKDPPAKSDTPSKNVQKEKVAKSTKDATSPAPRVLTIVKAGDLEYDDNQRIANYKNGVTLERLNTKVKAREIRAFLRNDSSDSSLDHAFADGQAEVVQSVPGRVRNGTAEHAEYYTDEDKVILEGGGPKFVDSVRGTTHGEKLTWFSKDDRLLVNGVPVKSVLHKKQK